MKVDIWLNARKFLKFLWFACVPLAFWQYLWVLGQSWCLPVCCWRNMTRAAANSILIFFSSLGISWRDRRFQTKMLLSADRVTVELCFHNTVADLSSNPGCSTACTLPLPTLVVCCKPNWIAYAVSELRLLFAGDVLVGVLFWFCNPYFSLGFRSAFMLLMCHKLARVLWLYLRLH